MQIAVLVFRVSLGMMFVFTGCVKLANHAAFVVQFAHWLVPHPNKAVLAIASLEAVCGALLALGLMTRAAALLLACVMVGAIMTAGKVDGGLHLLVPTLVFAGLIGIAWSEGREQAPSPSRRPGVQ